MARQSVKIHKEEQAKKLWCPFARVILDYGDMVVSGNRGWVDRTDQLNEFSRCIAADCQMWERGDCGLKKKFHG